MATNTVKPADARTQRVLFNMDEAGEATNLSRSELYAQMQAGRLKSVKVGRRRLIAAADLMAFIDLVRSEQTAGA